MRVEATGLCASSTGYTEEILIEKLKFHHFSAEDIDFIIHILGPHLTEKEQEYVAYAQAMWKLVVTGGMFVFDGDQAELVSQHLIQAKLTIYSNNHSGDDYRLVIAEKVALASEAEN